MPPMIKQRSDYTFKHNKSLGRHGWLRLTPAYSVKLVKSIMQDLPKDVVVLDPFSGTATTGLTAAEQGNQAVTFDINPFLIWIGKVKCRNYDKAYIGLVRERASRLAGKVEGRIGDKNWIPPIFNIERWWSPHTLKVLSALRVCLVEEFGEPSENKEDGLAWIAFCRLIIETSSAAFNHVSMSFSETVAHYEVEHVLELYLSILNFVLISCEDPIMADVEILSVDARDIPEGNTKFGAVITSPPYPNRISYIRELRPYMYWLRFLEEAREAGEMDWKAIGGTWGIATSRLNDWEPEVENLPDSLFKIVEDIADSDSKNAQLLANYVSKYFHDMHLHFSSLRNSLQSGAELNYIVGNSTFFGNVVHTEKLISESMKSLGYSDIKTEIIRKRNCKKALFEFNVKGKWKP